MTEKKHKSNLKEVQEEIKKEAKKIEKKIKKVKKKGKEVLEEIKEFVEGEKKETKEEKKKKTKEKEEKTLVALEDYIKASCHLGKKVITPEMREFVYRRRADGIAILNTKFIDEKLKQAIEFLANYEPKDIIIVCKREAGWKAAEVFSETTGIRAFIKKYPAGILTNISLPNFFETEVVIICDPWIDKNALKDAKRVNKKVVALCDTNNYLSGIDVIIPCNNKSNKSLGFILYLLARGYIKKRKMKVKMPKIEEFVGEEIDKNSK